MSPGDVRAAVAAAVATLLGSFAFIPVFTSGAWFWPVTAAILVVLAVGLLLRGPGRRAWAAVSGGRPPGRLRVLAVALVPLAQLFGVGWLLIALYAPARLYGGVLPTWRGVHALAGVMADGSVELREQSTPALPLHGLLALTVVLVGLVAVAVDLVAVAGRLAAVAGVGLLVLYCVPVSTITGGIGLLPMVAPAAGLALLLWTDQHRSLARRSRAEGGATGSGTLTALRIGLLALVGGLVVGSAVPTLREGSFASGSGTATVGSGSGSVGTRLDPVAALKGQLSLPDPVDLLRLRASVPDPGYLRAVALDVYAANHGWSLGNLDDEETVAGKTALAPLPTRESSRTVKASIRALKHDDRYLPVLSSPQSVTVRGAGEGDWRFDPATGTVFGLDVTTAGRSYTVVAEEPRPSVALLESSGALPATNPLERHYTQLPPLDPGVTSLVSRLTAGTSTPYAAVRSILDYFTDAANGFVYSLSTSPGTGTDALVNFLTYKKGYCEQFAGAMAVLVRAAGIPARVALGYTPGTTQPDGSRVITSHDAHAWVEVYFADLGWVPFDPTPIGQGRAVQLPWAPHQDSPAAQQNPAAASGAGTVPSQSVRTAVIDKGTPYVPLRLPAQQAAWVRPVAIGGGVLAVLAVLVALPAWLRARQRRRRLADGTAGSLWDELAATARDLGVPWHASRTPRQTARQLAELIRDAAPEPAGDGRRVRRPDQASEAVDAVRRLALAEEAASYARPGTEASASLGTALRTARRGLLRATPRRTRLRALLWPASVMADLAVRTTGRPARLRFRLPRPAAHRP